MSETFVLVTGACHGGWAWRPVANELRAAYHQVHTPPWPGWALTTTRAASPSPTV